MFTTAAKGIQFVLGKLLHKKKIFVTTSLNYLKRERQLDHNYFDYVRLATLELVKQEIVDKGLSGDVAELGVYKGKFARYINLYFPDRTLYLFDTFEGFDTRDIKTETSEKFSTGKQDFSKTSVEEVLNIMPHREKCIPVKGYFPESAKGIDKKFVFVSLDTDLYDPIYNGLKFFYPRLQKGGYIFVHDFNNDEYKGARKAVIMFCSENNIGYVPIPDSGGSIIITK